MQSCGTDFIFIEDTNHAHMTLRGFYCTQIMTPLSLPCYLSTFNNLKLYYLFFFSLMPAYNFFICTEATLNNAHKGCHNAISH